MAIYHLSAKLISRKAGRSATAAAASRAGERIVDTRTGEIHDYAKKRGIKHAELILPRTTDWRPTRAELWNAVESKNKRADAQVAREFVVALPDDLSPTQRTRLALDFAHEVADRYGVAADVAIHRPDRQGDQRNHHAHILTSTNRVEGYGFGNKVRELDLVAHNMGGKLGQDNAIDHLRQRWAELANAALEQAGHAERIDHRSHKARGIDLPATVHQGRRTHANADRWDARAEFNAWVQTQVELAKVRAQVERVQSQIVDLTSTLAQALAERNAQSAVREPGCPTVSPTPRIWTPSSDVPARDFSIAGLLARRSSAGPASRIPPRHRSPPQPEVSHDSDGFTQGDKPC